MINTAISILSVLLVILLWVAAVRALVDSRRMSLSMRAWARSAAALHNLDGHGHTAMRLVHEVRLDTLRASLAATLTVFLLAGVLHGMHLTLDPRAPLSPVADLTLVAWGTLLSLLLMVKRFSMAAQVPRRPDLAPIRGNLRSHPLHAVLPILAPALAGACL